MSLYLEQFDTHYADAFVSSPFNRDLDKFIQRLNVQGFNSLLLTRLLFADLYKMCEYHNSLESVPFDVTFAAWFKRSLNHFGINLDEGLVSDVALATPQSSDKE